MFTDCKKCGGWIKRWKDAKSHRYSETKTTQAN